jgi:hypothetical protein
VRRLAHHELREIRAWAAQSERVIREHLPPELAQHVTLALPAIYCAAHPRARVHEQTEVPEAAAPDTSA